jgi:hypothetical protein
MSSVTHQPDVSLSSELSIIVTEAQVLFRNFVETDRGVIEFLTDAEEPDVAAHRLLALGARAAGYVATTTYAEALQLLKSGVWQLHLGLNARGPEDSKSASCSDRILQKSGLAYSCIPT